MAYQLKRLLSRHYKMLGLLLEGKTQKQIADEMGYSPYGISAIVNSRVFQAELVRKRADLDERVTQAEVVRRLNARVVLDGVATEAAQKQASLLNSENERVAQLSAMDILDRTGCPKVSRSRNEQIVMEVVLDEKTVQRFCEAAKLCFGENFDIGKLLESDDGEATE